MYTGPSVPDCLHETNTPMISTSVPFPMASVQNASPTPTLAVLIVVDSSITLASEWPRIRHDYFPQLFRRLAGENASLAVRLRLSRLRVHSQNFHPFSTFAWDLSPTDHRTAVDLLFSLIVSSPTARSMS